MPMHMTAPPVGPSGVGGVPGALHLLPNQRGENNSFASGLSSDVIQISDVV